MRMLSPIFNPIWNRSLTSDLFEDFDRFFEGSDRQTLMPSVEVTESDEDYIVSFDVPGMKKEDLKIELNGQMLTVSGERKRESTSNKNDRVQHIERRYGSFQRSFELPGTIDADKVEAQYENGVLRVSLPKSATAKARRIEVRSGKNGGFVDRLLENHAS